MAFLRRVLRPQLLEIVEASDFGAEDMHHHIAGIDQHPVALGHAFDVQIAVARLLQLVDELVGNGADMAVGAARGHHHVVGNRRLTIEVDGDDLLGLGIVELGYEMVKIN